MRCADITGWIADSTDAGAGEWFVPTGGALATALPVAHRSTRARRLANRQPLLPRVSVLPALSPNMEAL